MATTKYNYRPHESLALIAKRYHTDIKTLTVLNSWLINPHTGKTEMYPAKINYPYTQENSIARLIYTDKPIKPGSITITAYERADKSGRVSTWTDDGKGLIKNAAGLVMYTTNYYDRVLVARDIITLQNMAEALVINYSANFVKDYLIVPLIGNGNTSIEDYWQNVDKITGISLGTVMENLSIDDKTLLDNTALLPITDNGVLNTSTMYMVEDKFTEDILNIDTESEQGSYSNNGYVEQPGSPETGPALSTSPDYSGIYGNSNEAYYTYSDAISDFTTARIGGIIQTAINEGSKNKRDYFLYDIKHNDTHIGNLEGSYGFLESTLGRQGTISPATYGTLRNGQLVNVHQKFNDLYGDLTDGTKSNWARDSQALYTYKTIGTQRDTSLLQAVEVVIGNTLIYMPCWPEQVEDGTKASYEAIDLMGRSAPYVIYSFTRRNEISFTFKLHREMLDTSVSLLTEDLARHPESAQTRAAEIDYIVRLIESAAYPNYNNTVAAVRTQVKIGNTLFISGVMTSQNTNWYGPIGDDRKYKQCDVSFTIQEATNDPKSQSIIANIGGWRTS